MPRITLDNEGPKTWAISIKYDIKYLYFVLIPIMYIYPRQIQLREKGQNTSLLADNPLSDYVILIGL